jgi:hypothetical protein
MAAHPEEIPEEIVQLLKIAAVPKEREAEAVNVLVRYLGQRKNGGKSAVRSLYDAAGQRGTPSGHNEHLNKVVKAAEALLKQLVALRRRPYAHADFWLHEGFGPVDEGGAIERPTVMRTLATIKDAASAGRMKKQGRPTALGKQRVVDTALDAFKRVAPDIEPTGYDGKPFCLFAEKFFKIGTGKKPGSLSRQIRVAVANRKNGLLGYTRVSEVAAQRKTRKKKRLPSSTSPERSS